MLRRTHLIVGVAITLPIIIYKPISIFGLIGSYIPDLDIKLGIKHRTITHSFLFLGISTLIVSILDSTIGFSWFLSYLSHLLADSLTVMGVPFLYPFKKKRYGLKIFKTGSFGDYIFQFISIAYILMVFFK